MTKRSRTSIAFAITARASMKFWAEVANTPSVLNPQRIKEATMRTIAKMTNGRLSFAECRFLYQMTFNEKLPDNITFIEAAEAAFEFSGEKGFYKLLKNIRDNKIVEQWVKG